MKLLGGASMITLAVADQRIASSIDRVKRISKYVDILFYVSRLEF